MAENWRRPYGLRPTVRHLMILTIHVAIVSAVVAPIVRGATIALTLGLGLGLAAILSPPVLAALILLLDRPGPAKYWLAGLVGSLFLPALIVPLDVMVAFGVLSSPGGLQSLLLHWFVAVPFLAVPLLALNALFLSSLRRTARRLPTRCPDCGRCSALPLGTRSSGFRWCASCGGRSAWKAVR